MAQASTVLYATGSLQYWTVPAAASGGTITFQITGGAGGGAEDALGGYGSYVYGTYPVTPGVTEFSVCLGNWGGIGVTGVETNATGGAGGYSPSGYPGGAGGNAYGSSSGSGSTAYSGGGGGGASVLTDITTAGGPYVVAVAAGGGGAGAGISYGYAYSQLPGGGIVSYSASTGGYGGYGPQAGNIAATYSEGTTSYPTAATGGGAPTTSAGGAAGTAASISTVTTNPTAGAAGTNTSGGAGGTGSSGPPASISCGGGGGGGGIYGGGGGGGGGSNTSPVVFSGGGAGAGGQSAAPAAYGAAPIGTAYFDDGLCSGPGYCAFVWLVAPSTSVTSPALNSTYTTSAAPPIVHSYTPPSGTTIQQQSWTTYIYQVPTGYTDSMPTNFNPATGGYTGDNGVPLVPIWTNGTVQGTGTTDTPTTAIPNGNMVACVQVVDAGGVGAAASAWAYGYWTQSAPGPAAPTISVQAIQSQALAQLRLTPGSPPLTNLLPPVDANIENPVGTAAPASSNGWNGSGQSYVGDWLNGAAIGTMTASSAQAQSGTYSLAWTASAAGQIGASIGGLACVPGTTYSAMASFRAATAGVTCGITLTFYSGPFNSSTLLGIHISTVTDTTSGWTKATVSGTAPLGTTGMSLQLFVEAGASGQVHYADEIGLFSGSTTTWANNYSSTVTPTTADFHVQRSADAVNWEEVANGATIANVVGNFPTSFNDIGCPRETTTYYRVQGLASEVGGQLVAGPWSNIVSCYLESDSQEWLMCSAEPSLSMPIVWQGPDLSALSHQDVGVYQPEGRPDAVIFSGTIHDEAFVMGTGSQLMTFAFANDNSFATWTAMRATNAPLLFKSLYGGGPNSTQPIEQFWFKPAGDQGTKRVGGGTRQGSLGQRGDQIRTISIPGYVVSEP